VLAGGKRVICSLIFHTRQGRGKGNIETNPSGGSSVQGVRDYNVLLGGREKSMETGSSDRRKKRKDLFRQGVINDRAYRVTI